MKTSSILALSGALATLIMIYGCAGNGPSTSVGNPFAGTRHAQLCTLDRVAIASMNTTVTDKGAISGSTVNGGGVGTMPAGELIAGEVNVDGTVTVSLTRYSLTGRMLLSGDRGAGTLFARGELVNQGNPKEKYLFEWWNAK